jgi:hypothetical protein
MTEALNAGVNEEFAMIGRSLILLAGVLLFADARDAIAGGGGAANPESSTSRDSVSGADAAALQRFFESPEYKACKSSSGLGFMSQGKGPPEPPPRLKLYYCWNKNADAVWTALGSLKAVKDVKGVKVFKEEDKRPLGIVRSIERVTSHERGYDWYITCVLAE